MNRALYRFFCCGAQKTLPLLAVSGLAGFLIGAVCHPVWQVPVETAQVLAGLVEYPDNNPYYIYHLKAWSLLCQFSALLLTAGLSEAAVSVILSGLFGMLAFQALCFTTFAVCRKSAIALSVPLFLYCTGLLGHGISYPILWFKNVDSFGGFGLFGAVLAVGLLGSARYRPGCFLLGILPALHGAYGIWLFAVCAVMALLDRRLLIRIIRLRAVPFFCAGLAVSIASFLWQWMQYRHLPAADPDAARTILVAFVRNLDYHRRPFEYLHRGELTALFSAVVSLLFLLRTGRRDSRRSLPLFLAVSFLLANLAAAITHLDPQHVPSFILTLMPGRFINLNNVLLVPLLFGVLGGRRGLLPALAAAVFTAVALLLTTPELLPNLPGTTIWLPGACAAAACAVLLRQTAHPPREGKPVHVLRILTAVLTGLFFLRTLTWTLPDATARYDRVFGQTERTVFKTASQDKGLLMVSSDIRLAQLLTRRPVLLEADSIDGLAYAPESALPLAQILREIYGVDLFQKPPPGVSITGGIPKTYKDLWENRTVSDWKDIRNRFGITGILAVAPLRLHLPVAAQDDEFTLYTIPASP